MRAQFGCLPWGCEHRGRWQGRGPQRPRPEPTPRARPGGGRAAALAQSQSAPAIPSGAPRDADGAGGAGLGEIPRGPGRAQASWQRAAGLTREQAADRASMLRHRVAEAASELAARQERKRAPSARTWSGCG